MDSACSGYSSVEHHRRISIRSGNQIEHKIKVGYVGTHRGFPLMASCRFPNRDRFFADAVRRLHYIAQYLSH